MKILVLGVTGMLGNAIFRRYSVNGNIKVYGTARSNFIKKYFDDINYEQVICGVDAHEPDCFIDVFESVMPDVVINCIGLIKQASDANNSLHAIAINALLPHRLAELCKLANARLIHISTDCVFSGAKGNYIENDFSDANDLYGRSKYLGEVNYPHAVTLRTSIIGHELHGRLSLVDWFLSQQGSIKGYRNAIFSGLPTTELARVIWDYVIPNPQLFGLYHVSVDSISKFDLLSIIATKYQKRIEILPDDAVRIDRSLDSSKFRLATGFKPKPWEVLIEEMHNFSVLQNIRK